MALFCGDMRLGGATFFEKLILYEIGAGAVLVMELADHKNSKNGRIISVSAVPFGPSIARWRSCRFLGGKFRALTDMLGGMGRFLPCKVGGNHCRLRHIGWERCGQSLTSRPREAAEPRASGPLLLLLVYTPPLQVLIRTVLLGPSSLDTVGFHLLGNFPHGLFR